MIGTFSYAISPSWLLTSIRVPGIVLPDVNKVCMPSSEIAGSNISNNARYSVGPMT